MASSTGKKSKVDEGNPVTLVYLIAYNVAQILGWSAIFMAMVTHILTEMDYKGIYTKVSPLLNIFQTAAILEIVHCAVGFVRSNVILTAFQVFSRVFLTWGIAYSVPVMVPFCVTGHISEITFIEQVQDIMAVTLFLMAWSITEMVRYSFYLFALIGEVPYPIKWCRYTFFIVLYPIGVTGELLSIFNSLDYVQKSKLYSIALPNAANMSFSYFYFLIFIMLSYIPALHAYDSTKEKGDWWRWREKEDRVKKMDHCPAIGKPTINPFPDNKILDCSNLKDVADDNSK